MEKDTPNVCFLPKCREFQCRGRVLVRLLFLCPVVEKKQQINAFYEEMYENLLSYTENIAHRQEETLLHGTRAERKAFRELSLRFSSKITFSDGEYLSILWEYARMERGARPVVKRMAQTFSVERETLLPPTAFLLKKGEKCSPDAPYYLTENGVVFL